MPAQLDDLVFVENTSFKFNSALELISIYSHHFQKKKNILPIIKLLRTRNLRPNLVNRNILSQKKHTIWTPNASNKKKSTQNLSFT